MAYLPRFIRGTVLATLSCGLFLTLTAPAALAHDSLKSSFPAKNAGVSSVERIELEFSARVMFPAVALREADGEPVAVGEPRVDGPKVTSEVGQALSPGEYVIGWRVVSSDGHPIEGEIPFTVTGPATPSASPASTAPLSPSPRPAAVSPAPVAAAPVPAADDQDTSRSVPGWIWGGLVALVVIGAAVWFRSSRRGRPDTTK